MRFFSFDKTGAGGGWRRTGTSEWKKSMDENALLRQTSRQPGSKRSETQVFRVSKEVAPAKKAAEERERKEAAEAHRRAKQAGRAARKFAGVAAVSSGRVDAEREGESGGREPARRWRVSVWGLPWRRWGPGSAGVGAVAVERRGR